MHTVAKNGDRQELRLGLKTIGSIVGLIVVGCGTVIAIMALMFYPLRDGEKTRTDFDHHATVSDKAIGKLEEEDKEIGKALHRIELRQVRSSAPRHIRAKLPDVPMPAEFLDDIPEP